MPKARNKGLTEAERIEREKECFLYYFEKSGGNVTEAIKAAKKTTIKKYKGFAISSRTTYYNWCKADPDFAAKCDEVDESNLDEAESALMELVKGRDYQAIKFLLSTKGKKRGYVTRTEIAPTDNLPFRIEIVGSPKSKPVSSEDDIAEIPDKAFRKK